MLPAVGSLFRWRPRFRLAGRRCILALHNWRRGHLLRSLLARRRRILALGGWRRRWCLRRRRVLLLPPEILLPLYLLLLSLEILSLLFLLLLFLPT